MLWPALLLPLAVTPSIDFDARAMAVGQALAKLSQTAGVPLKASNAIAPEIIYVRAHGVELPALKQKIAEALSARWEHEKDADVLVRSHTDDKAIWSEHVSYRRRLVDEGLKEAEKALQRKFDGQALARGMAALKEPDANDRTAAQRYYEALTDFSRQGPLGRLLFRLTLACNRDDLAGLGPFERRVFTPHPTAAQFAIDPAKYEAAISAFAKEQQEWMDEAAKVNFPESSGGRMSSDPRSQLRYPPKLDFSALVVHRGEMTSLFLVDLEAKGEDFPGASIATQYAFPDPGRRYLNSTMNPSTPPPDDPEVALSPDSREFQQGVFGAFMDRNAKPLTPRLKELMLDVMNRDPLSLAVSDLLDAYGKAENSNIVAALPDLSTAIAINSAQSGPLRVRQGMKAQLDSGALKSETKDGWTILSPPDRYEALLDFTRRPAVAELMKTTFELGRLDIKAYAKYAFGSNRLNRGGLGDWFLAMYDRSVLGASDRTEWKALQLYGAFDAEGQRALESGAAIPYSTLTPDQRAIVDRIVYAKRLYGEMSPGVLAYNAVEPTEAYPRGVPGSCTISAKVNNIQVIVAYSKDESGKVRPARNMDPWTLASYELDVLGNNELMARFGVPNPAGYALGFEKKVRLHVQVDARAYADLDITVPDYDPNASPGPWKELPETFRKQVEDAIVRRKEQKSGGGTPPP